MKHTHGKRSIPLTPNLIKAIERFNNDETDSNAYKIAYWMQILLKEEIEDGQTQKNVKKEVKTLLPKGNRITQTQSRVHPTRRTSPLENNYDQYVVI